MLLLLIENASRMLMEWSIKKQYKNRPIIDEIADGYSYHLSKLKS